MKKKVIIISAIIILIVIGILAYLFLGKENKETVDNSIASESVESSTPEPTAEPTEPPHEHAYKETVTTEAACETDGLKTFTCECGDTYTEVIKATGHDYDGAGEYIEEEQITLHCCTVCGYEFAESHRKEVPESTEQPAPEQPAKEDLANIPKEEYQWYKDTFGLSDEQIASLTKDELSRLIDEWLQKEFYNQGSGSGSGSGNSSGRGSNSDGSDVNEDPGDLKPATGIPDNEVLPGHM